MKISAIITILVIFTVQINAQKVVAYLPYYRGYNSNFDYSLYTHIHYFSIWPEADGSFNYPGSMDSLSMAEDFHNIAAAAQPHGVKMIMTFGGTAENGSKYFVDLSSNDTYRANFIANVSDLCDTWLIDGIDIDWEWSAPSDTAISNYAYKSLMQDIRTLTTNKGISFSIDISPSSWNGQYSPPEAVNLADYLNVMTYSYNGSWSSTTGHHTSINKAVNTGLAYWTGKGIEASKLNIGIAYYGFTYEGTYQNDESFTNVSEILYKDILDLINSGYTVMEDSSDGTYCYSITDNKIVYYDSPKNAANKMQYAIDNELSGVIIWELGGESDNQPLSLAIDSTKKGVISLIPNIEDEAPNAIHYGNKLIIQNIQNSMISLNIYSINGKRVFTEHSDEKNIFQINLNPGIYICMIQQDNHLSRKKIIIY